MSRTKALFAGFLAGLVAGIAMTTAMLLLAWVFGIATVIIGDRISGFLAGVISFHFPLWERSAATIISGSSALDRQSPVRFLSAQLLVRLDAG
ncbi:MAG TPA: hypothetical protein VGI41_10300 [Candidatus Udaeobacter sp.]|jgi:predicted lipid-binding transport protein (Tim44 family)